MIFCKSFVLLQDLSNAEVNRLYRKNCHDGAENVERDIKGLNSVHQEIEKNCNEIALWM